MVTLKESYEGGMIKMGLYLWSEFNHIQVSRAYWVAKQNHKQNKTKKKNSKIECNVRRCTIHIYVGMQVCGWCEVQAQI